MCHRKPALAGVTALALLAGALVAGCSQQQFADAQAKVTAFEAKAAPAIAKGCDAFHAAEASPLVQTGLAVGTMAANAATGVPVAGLAVSAIKGFGDQFCQAGPPVGDATTPDQQAGWLAGVTQQLIDAAGKAAGATA